jgi:hypothetical protein
VLTRSDSSPPESAVETTPALPPGGGRRLSRCFFVPMCGWASDFVRLTAAAFVSRDVLREQRVFHLSGLVFACASLRGGRLSRLLCRSRLPVPWNPKAAPAGFGAIRKRRGVAFSTIFRASRGERAAGLHKSRAGGEPPAYTSAIGNRRRQVGVWAPVFGTPVRHRRIGRNGAGESDADPPAVPRTSESVIHNHHLVHRHEPPARPSPCRPRRWGQFSGGPASTDLPDPWRFRAGALAPLSTTIGPPVVGDR